jgi:DNA-binding NtrC family response regulator
MNRSKANQKPNPGTSAAATIFIIDDEPMLLELGVMLLAPAGYHLRIFRSAEDAFAAFLEGTTRPDLIITDYAMQEMTGMDLIKKCREIFPAQKVILVSGTVDERIYTHAACKPDRFLAKPYTGRQLTRAVHEVLKSSPVRSPAV